MHAIGAIPGLAQLFGDMLGMVDANVKGERWLAIAMRPVIFDGIAGTICVDEPNKLVDESRRRPSSHAVEIEPPLGCEDAYRRQPAAFDQFLGRRAEHEVVEVPIGLDPKTLPTSRAGVGGDAEQARVRLMPDQMRPGIGLGMMRFIEHDDVELGQAIEPPHQGSMLATCTGKP